MLNLRQATIHQLSLLLEQRQPAEIDGLLLPKSEEIAPRFLLEFAVSQLSQDPENSFWWSPRLIVVDQSIVGMCSFKRPPDSTDSIEIGYGIATSWQQRGFATQAVDLLVREGFLSSKIQKIIAYTSPSNTASWQVLEKNRFVRDGSKIAPDDGKVWIWQRSR
ncbi:MAG: GNAT family N-acetyltransferase [Cyanothece sp. SIO1E1]|nr:GNAT family N-acetyltransferase [Cyanothece sp. SIO1E1]